MLFSKGGGKYPKKTKKNKKRKTNTKKDSIVRKQFNHIFFHSMKDYLKEISNNKYQFAVHESGGGGDCLFHSISAGIEIANSISKFKENRKLSAKDLRKIVSDSILEWDQNSHQIGPNPHSWTGF